MRVPKPLFVYIPNNNNQNTNNKLALKMNQLKDKSAKNSVNQNISQNFLLAALKVK